MPTENQNTEINNEANLEESTEKTVSKALFDKQASELANYKKQLKARMTAEEQAKIEMQEKENEINSLKAFKRSSELTTGLIGSLGAEHSKSISDAIVGGETESIITAINEAFNKLLKAKDDEIANLKLDAMNQGSNGSNSGSENVTVADFRKMSIDERIALKNQNPSLFEKLRKGK